MKAKWKFIQRIIIIIIITIIIIIIVCYSKFTSPVTCRRMIQHKQTDTGVSEDLSGSFFRVGYNGLILHSQEPATGSCYPNESFPLLDPVFS
jgi:hypothetical protein